MPDAPAATVWIKATHGAQEFNYNQYELSKVRVASDDDGDDWKQPT